MDEYIGVAVAKQTEPTPIPSRGEGRFNYITIRSKLIEGYFDASKPEGAALYDAMDVVTKTDSPPPTPPKGRRGLISYVTGFQCIRYIFQDVVDITENLFVSVAEYDETSLIQMRCSLSIFFRLFSFKMISAINFYDDSMLQRNKIRNIAKDRVLTPKMSSHFVPRQIFP